MPGTRRVRSREDGTWPQVETYPVYGTGKVGRSIVLDGIDDFGSAPYNVANSDDITVATWINWDGGDNWQFSVG